MMAKFPGISASDARNLLTSLLYSPSIADYMLSRASEEGTYRDETVRICSDGNTFTVRPHKDITECA